MAVLALPPDYPPGYPHVKLLILMVDVIVKQVPMLRWPKMREKTRNCYLKLSDRLGSEPTVIMGLFLSTLFGNIYMKVLMNATFSLIIPLPMFIVLATANSFYGAIAGCGLLYGYWRIPPGYGRYGVLVASGLTILWEIFNILLDMPMTPQYLGGMLVLLALTVAYHLWANNQQSRHAERALCEQLVVFASGLLLGPGLRHWVQGGPKVGHLSGGASTLADTPLVVPHFLETMTTVLALTGVLVSSLDASGLVISIMCVNLIVACGICGLTAMSFYGIDHWRLIHPTFTMINAIIGTYQIWDRIVDVARGPAETAERVPQDEKEAINA